MKTLNAYLANWDVIKIVSSEILTEQDISVFRDDEYYGQCFYKDYHHIKNEHVYYYYVNRALVLGCDYFLSINSSRIRIDVSPASLLPNFDEFFAYNGNDLGNIYTENEILFSFWCPHASKVTLEYKVNNETSFIEMSRKDRGVYRISIPKTNEYVFYRYHAVINGVEVVGADPFSKYGFNNLEYSVASNDDTYVNLNLDALSPLERIEHVIYETNVRDFTIHKGSNIVNKGKFIGLVEEGRTTAKGNPAGLDYLKYIGITTIQLQPIFDIATIDEKNPDKSYNWGYDPEHYFILEGSYSSNINKPTQAVIDFKKMVAKLHKNNLRVSIDVVYNHMYEPKDSLLERFVPFYFFRRDKYWKLQNHCGCGGDFATERAMGRKMIIDSLIYLVKDLGVDAIRFDLMGLIDINTMRIAYEKCKDIRPDMFFYGEGWNMGGAPYDHSKCLTLDYAKEIPEIGFFNDRYRNIVKGIGGEVKPSENGFILGNQNFVFGFKFVHSGSCTNTTYPALFLFPHQSINYVECHDNAALFDTIKASMSKCSDSLALEYSDLFLKVLASSIGVVFIHAGQEIGFSKQNEHNTYNIGDEYNNFDYDLLDERFEHATLLRTLLINRKKYKLFKLDNSVDIKKSLEYTELPKGILIKNTVDNDTSFIINPFNNIINYTFDKDNKFIVKPFGKNIKDIHIKNVSIQPIDAYVLFKEWE